MCADGKCVTYRVQGGRANHDPGNEILDAYLVGADTLGDTAVFSDDAANAADVPAIVLARGQERDADAASGDESDAGGGAGGEDGEVAANAYDAVECALTSAAFACMTLCCDTTSQVVDSSSCGN